MLAGCSVSTSRYDDFTPSYRPFLDNDETLKELSFSNGSYSKNDKFGDLLGYFNLKFDKNPQTYIFSNGDMGKSISIVNIDNGYLPLKKLDINSLKSLHNSKKIKFYEFGREILESIIFEDKSGVCSTFNSGKMVNVRAVTNYYNPNNKNEFFTTIINMKVNKNKNDVKNINFKYHISDNKLKSETQQFAQGNDFRNIIQQDIDKQKNILANILCINL